VFSPNTILVTNLIEDILKKKEINIKNPLIPLSTLKRFFNHVIKQEAITDEKRGYQAPLSVVCFDILLNKYGLRSIAEQKLSNVTNSK